jgi:squalene-hopene/tetraprenyl-beta-curcumene cyclase
MNDVNTREVATVRRRVDAARLDVAITRASESLIALQHPDGHWVFELEADVTIPSEFSLLQH